MQTGFAWRMDLAERAISRYALIMMPLPHDSAELSRACQFDYLSDSVNHLTDRVAEPRCAATDRCDLNRDRSR